MFYQILQYGQVRGSHRDIEYNDEKTLKEVSNRIVTKAKKMVKQGLLLEGNFDVLVCQENGKEVNTFISNTDAKY